MTDSLFPDIATRAERRISNRNHQPDCDAVSMGAGVQGATIALLIHQQRIPTPDYAVFADTGWEPAAVYTQLDRINRELLQPAGTQLLIVTNGNIRDEIHDPHAYTRIPAYTRAPDGRRGLLKRTCTGHFKLTAIFRAHRAILGAPTRELPCTKCAGTGQRPAPWLIKYNNNPTPGICSICHGVGHVTRVGAPPKGHWVRAWIGFSTDEVDRCGPSPVPYSENHYPLLEDHIRMTRDDCKTFNAANGFGDVVKSACIGCPYRSAAEWRQIKASPNEWAEAVAADEALRNQPGLDGTAYLHKDRVPLPLADISGCEEPGEQRGCSPYGCRSGDPIDMPGLFDELDEVSA